MRVGNLPSFSSFNQGPVPWACGSHLWAGGGRSTEISVSADSRPQRPGSSQNFAYSSTRSLAGSRARSRVTGLQVGTEAGRPCSSAPSFPLCGCVVLDSRLSPAWVQDALAHGCWSLSLDPPPGFLPESCCPSGSSWPAPPPGDLPEARN